MRGEYASLSFLLFLLGELPPRARRIPVRATGFNIGAGTTSACAENTPAGWAGERGRWNYLRVRGEYPQRKWPGRLPPELPPRARRILHRFHPIGIVPGTTSACAENTNPGKSYPTKPWNYLRVRGEYRSKHVTRTHVVELPPRARRIPNLRGL